eukprot:2362366-Alexandrium_andersonii.AAC.1
MPVSADGSVRRASSSSLPTDPLSTLSRARSLKPSIMDDTAPSGLALRVEPPRVRVDVRDDLLIR